MVTCRAGVSLTENFLKTCPVFILTDVVNASQEIDDLSTTYLKGSSRTVDVRHFAMALSSLAAIQIFTGRRCLSSQKREVVLVR